MIIFLYIYSSLIYALSPSSLILENIKDDEDRFYKNGSLHFLNSSISEWCEQLNIPPSLIPVNIKHGEDLKSQITTYSEDQFYKNGLLYFLRSTSVQEFENRVAKWCTQFDIPTEFDSRWTPLWYGKEKVIPFEEIKARWKKNYGLEDSLGLFDEIHIRDMEAIASYISSYSGGSNASRTPSYESCIRYFFNSPSLEEYHQRIDNYCQQFHVEASVRSTARVSQKDYDITPVIKDLHHEWQKILQDKIPHFINNHRSCSIETLLMFGALSCTFFKREALKKEILRRVHENPKFSYPPVTDLKDQTKKILEQEDFINDNQWNERTLYLMTDVQKKRLYELCSPPVIDSLYAQSFFYLLREIAKRGASHTTPYERREKFISELEFYMVELYNGKEKAFDEEKSHRTLIFLKLTSVPHYDVYVESVDHFYQKVKRLKPQLEALSNKEQSYRTDKEIQELWKNLLKKQLGLCPTGAIERPLFYLEEFYDWSNLSCKKDMFIAMVQNYYAYIVEKIAGSEVWSSRGYSGNEAHAGTRIHNILSQGSYGYLSEVDKHELDVYAASTGRRHPQEIQEHFESLFTPFHFGGYVLEFFQDKRFLKVFASLKEVQQRKDLFMDDLCLAFRINHFMLHVGEGFMSFDHEYGLRKQQGVITEMLLDQTLSNQNPNPTDIELFIPTYEETELVYRCLERGAFPTLKHLLSLNAHLKKENLAFVRVLNSCLQHDCVGQKRLNGLDMLKCFYAHSRFPEDKSNFMPNSKTTLSHIIVKLKEEYKVFPYIVYFIEELKFSPFLGDSNLFAYTPLHWACRYGHLSLVKWLVEIQNMPPDYSTQTGYTTIAPATLGGHKKVLEYLIDRKGVNVANKMRCRHTAFHWACHAGHLSIVKWLIEEKDIDPNYCEPGKQSALSHAFMFNHQDIVEYLIGQGASPTLTDKTMKSYNLLHRACYYGHLSLVKWLIPLCVKERGSFDFEEYIEIAINKNHVAIVEHFICEVGSPMTEKVESFLKKRGRTDTLKTSKEIENIAVFLERGHNPFLTLYRLNQVRKAMKKNNDPSLLERTSRWSHYFIHRKNYFKALNFWNRRDLKCLGSLLILKSS